MRRDHILLGLNGDFHHIDWGGSGPLAHFAHATGFCAGTYTPLIELLRRHVRMLGMDHRGHGRTTAPADPQELKSWYFFADDLERFFEHLGEPVIAMGHSLGAAASLLVAIKRPELIRALVLIDPTILPFSWMWWWFLAQKTGLIRLVPIVAKAARRRSVWPDRESILAAYQHNPPFQSWQKGFLEAYIADGTEETGNGTIRLRCHPAWESRCFAAYPADMWRHIRQVQPPTLLLYGAQSVAFRASAAKRLTAKLQNAVVRRFEKTSHFVPMERPDECVEVIIAFLRNMGAS